MAKTGSSVLLRSVEDRADAKVLREVISIALTRPPINLRALRTAVCNFVQHESRSGEGPDGVIARLVALIEESGILPSVARLRLTRRMILWCVDDYFGPLNGDGITLNGVCETAGVYTDAFR